jgi:hypothetical protein
LADALSRAFAQPGVVGDPGACGRSLCGNREISGLASGRIPVGPHREGEEPKPMMHEPEKSDSAIVATKAANKAGQPVAELVERKAGTGGTRTSKARAGHRTGKACHRRWAACGKSQRCAASRQILSVGAGCLNWARPDLCGGRPVMVVPTANTHGRGSSCDNRSVPANLRLQGFHLIPQPEHRRSS